MKTFFQVFCLAVLVALTSGSAVAAPKAFEFHIEKISDSLYSIRPEKYWRVNSTSVVYVGERGLLLLDAQTDGNMALQMVRTIQRRIANLPLEYIVVTHPHLDHIGGLAALKQKYPQVKIIAQSRMTEFIRERSEKEREFEVGVWLQPLLDSKRSTLLKMEDAAQRRELKAQIEELANYIADIRAIKFIKPDILFDHSLVLNFNQQKIQLTHYSSAHTPADITVYFEQEKVLATGDLFHNLDPLFWDEASPEGWVHTLDKVLVIDANRYLGGHGDSISDKQLLVFWRNYIAELIKKVKSAKAQGLSLEQLQQQLNVKGLQAFAGNEYAARIAQQSNLIMPFEDSMEAKLDRELAGLWPKF